MAALVRRVLRLTMTTTYYVPLNQRDRDVLCSAHRAEMVAATMQIPPDWEARRRHCQRIDHIRLLDWHDRIALDQGEFELIGEQVLT
jgi:hypothetical protein